MIRYRLDDLGWYQFEWLVQALLKAELGLGVESWATTHGDIGRDAYFDGELTFPGNAPTPGPFVFQVKFVENASARGGDPIPALLSAVRKEAARIKSRQGNPLLGWETPAHYALITNTPLAPNTREDIAQILHESLPTARVTSLGAPDVCDIIDAHPSLRRSFPQLLSLRDLNELLADAAARDLLERSRAAVDASREVVRAFVPTAAYERTWNVLRSHHFAVLYGPPEMGKTAIAWMVALAQLSQGWDSYLCQSPAEFFRLFAQERSQVFVADDAFGRTEYDPASTLLWEKDLPYIIPRLDQKHWLVLTSRRHLLERARQQMDLQGAAARFPTPASVLIDAGKLSKREKALMLYRHARESAKTPEALRIVRENAWKIVEHASFTPERIRRFVNDRLPELVRAGTLLDGERLQSEIAEAIRNPTRGMELAFKALDEPYKWFLIALLEAGGYWAPIDAVRRYYDDHCPREIKVAFDSIQDQLLEAFVRWADQSNKWLMWIHPSCRDLVIDELVADERLRHRFLATASLQGLQLAFSVMGGPEGKRNLPLMIDDASWRLVEQRIASWASQLEPSEAAALLTSLKATLLAETPQETRDRLRRILMLACEEIRNAWNAQGRVFGAEELAAFAAATVLLEPLPELPSLGPSWTAATSSLVSELEIAESGEFLRPGSLHDWVDLATAISDNEPRFLAQLGFPKGYASRIESCLKIAEDELTAEPEFDEPSDMRAEAARLTEIANSLQALTRLAPDYAPHATDLASRLVTKSGALEDRANEEEGPEPDYDDARDSMGEDFDVRLIFSDL